MNIKKSNSRDRKRHKKIHGMQEDGRGVKLLQEILIKRAQKAKLERENSNG